MDKLTLSWYHMINSSIKTLLYMENTVWILLPMVCILIVCMAFPPVILLLSVFLNSDNINKLYDYIGKIYTYDPIPIEKFAWLKKLYPVEIVFLVLCTIFFTIISFGIMPFVLIYDLKN